MENLTHPIIINYILNATLNSTLFQPPQEWYYVWLKNWSSIILGIAQIAVAAVLAWLTKKLWQVTSDYSNQVRIQTDILTKNSELSEKDLEIVERNRQRETLVKEMDKLIGPLYSHIDDKEIFNPRGTGGGRYWMNSKREINPQFYAEGVFWQEIAQYKYLAPLDVQIFINKYLDIKLRSAKMGKWDDPEYEGPESSLKNAIERRYSEIVYELYELSKLDNNQKPSSSNDHGDVLE